MAHSIFHVLSGFFARYGYGVVFFGVMAENIGVPVPGETVLLFAGFLAYHGKLHILPAILIAIAGATLGAIAGFFLGRYGGTSVVNRLLRHFPRFTMQYEAAHKMILKHGPWAVFVARFITGVRVFAGILPGTLQMPFPTFLVYSFAGAVCWSVAIACVGLLFGSSWRALFTFVRRLDRLVLVIIAALALVLLTLHFIRRRKPS